MQKWFLDNNYTPADYRSITSVTIPQNSYISALKSGQVDAIYLQSSAFYLAQEDPQVEEVVEARNIVGDRMQTGYLVRKDWVEKNPQVAAGFVRAITKAWNWSAEHPDQIQTIAAEVIKDHNQDPSLAKFVYAWQRPDGLWKDDDVIFWIQRLQAGGVLKRNLTPSNIFTNQYNPNYNPSTADNT